MSRRVSMVICGALIAAASYTIAVAQPTQVPIETQRRIQEEERLRNLRSGKLPGSLMRTLPITRQRQHAGGRYVEWHPRNNSLLVTGGLSLVWDVANDGGATRRLPAAPLWGGVPLAWSPNGSLLAFQTTHDPGAPMDTLMIGEVEHHTGSNCLFCIVPVDGYARNGYPSQLPRAIVSTDPLKKLGPIVRAAFSPDNTRLAVLDANATVAVYDVKSRGEVLRFSRGFDRPDASGVATESIPIFFDWSPRGRILVGIARESSPGVRTGVQIRQADGGEKLASAMIEANARTTDAFFNPADPSQILVVATDLTIVDADTRATIRTIPIGQVIRHAEWRPDGAMILSVTDANLVQIWNAATGAAIRSTEGRGAAWSPDNSKLAVGRRNEVIIQSAGDGAQLEALPLLSDEQFAGPLAWRPSGTGIAGRGGSNMYIWPVH